MRFVDFAELKQAVAIEDALTLLDLDLKQRGGQWRGPCPACKTGGNRALVVTAEKSAFYCFGGRTGGDVIALVAHVRGLSMKEAGLELARMTGNEQREAKAPPTPLNTVPEERKKEAVRSLQPLAYLQAEHDLVLKLGIEAETAKYFGAGYAAKGIMRGRLAIPIHDNNGALIAYAGKALRGEEPDLIFPNGFDPAREIFNAHRFGKILENGEGEVILAHDPLEVMRAFQAGIVNAISFLTETISASQLEQLADLLRSSGCEQLQIA